MVIHGDLINGFLTILVIRWLTIKTGEWVGLVIINGSLEH